MIPPVEPPIALAHVYDQRIRKRVREESLKEGQGGW